MKVHGDSQSGNCYKIKLLLALLDQAHEWIAIDILRGQSRSAEFLAKNPNGKIPLLELADGRCLAESNAILNYLAEGTPFLPAERFARAQVLQWQFFEQYSHEPCIAVARYIARYLGLPPERRSEYEALQAGGHRALAVLDGALRGRHWLVGDQLTIADISLYAYTHVADEGGFALDAYPAIQEWLVRTRQLPGYVGMDGQPVISGEPT
jgi:glutathione S-transferase